MQMDRAQAPPLRSGETRVPGWRSEAIRIKMLAVRAFKAGFGWMIIQFPFCFAVHRVLQKIGLRWPMLQVFFARSLPLRVNIAEVARNAEPFMHATATA